MSFSKIAAAWNRLRRRGSASSHALPAPAQVRRLLDVERIRADRTGEPLSLVAFAPRTREAAAATAELLAVLLRSRLRVTDHAGWLSRTDLCAVLPFTPAAGAWKVADDICLQFPETVPPPICTVYSYPSGQLPAVPLQSAGDDSGRLSKRPSSRTDGMDATQTPVPAMAGRTREPQPATASLEPFFHLPVPPLKRLADIAGAIIGLCVVLLILPFVAAAIRLTSRGPVFFRQKRAGQGGRTFEMWKFRTMVADAEARKADLMAKNEQDGPAFKIKHDPRITRVGRFLRSTSLDELPQFWNVLLGDMSLVGPRPLPCRESDGCEPWQRRRLDVKPGLTCIWQVRGRSAVSFDDWVRMDVEYIETQSIGTDLRLMLLTVPALVLRKGAH
ncbi:MAG: sugar transferase [Gemmataceae bacterium]